MTNAGMLLGQSIILVGGGYTGALVASHAPLWVAYVVAVASFGIGSSVIHHYAGRGRAQQPHLHS